jgi:hypothetical protein
MITTDPTHPDLGKPDSTGMNKAYLVLSEEERSKGFVRPLHQAYVHVGTKPKYPLRDLTSEEKVRYSSSNYSKFESYPEENSPVLGKYWTQSELNRITGCGTKTTMGLALCETYARNPKFYGLTFCCGCGSHFPVSDFVWDGTSDLVGS